jgi:hypothetical protein
VSEREDFWTRVDVRSPDQCWPWKAGKRVRDYGGLLFNGKIELASRVAFFLTHRYWPQNTRHSCDYPPCCNPAHILEGSHAENMADKVARGRQPRGEQCKWARLTETDDDRRALALFPPSRMADRRWMEKTSGVTDEAPHSFAQVADVIAEGALAAPSAMAPAIRPLTGCATEEDRS